MPHHTPRQCTFCVMTDACNPITFDERGQCDACKLAVDRLTHEWFLGEDGRARLQAMIDELKRLGKGQHYDAVIGLSGGIDSAYLAHLAVKEWGLRCLAIHVDAGWNSTAAVKNIERIVRGLNLDLHTEVIEWAEISDLQLSFLKASTMNQDIPQDHAFFSSLYRTCGTFGVRNFLSGVNYATENIQPSGSGVGYMDSRFIKAIQRQFGTRKLQRFRIMSIARFLWITKVLNRPRVFKPLNYLNYNKDEARRCLQHHYGWLDYGDKHCESRFTKFFQEVYLPRKFAFDKRRLHLSSLIVSGQIKREDALAMLETPIVSDVDRARQIRFVAKKLDISAGELEALMDTPAVEPESYSNSQAIVKLLFRLRYLLTGRLSPLG